VPVGVPELAAGLAGPVHAQLETFAGIIARPVPASLGGGAARARLLLNWVRVAAVPSAAGNAMIGELFPEERQRPVP
jgi:hypothetical protein